MNNESLKNLQLPARKRRVIAILRVSTDAQDLARQRADIKRTSAQYNLEVVRTLELQGVSGTAVLDNAQVQQVLRDLEDPSIDGVVCSSLDRIFRPKNGIQFQIMDRQKLLWTAREGELDSHSDAGWETCMNLGVRAGAEWRELKRRSMGGKRENAEAGFWNGGTAPYGYQQEYRDARKGKRASLTIFEPEAQVVRQIFSWAMAGLGVMAIAKKLNLAGILTQRAGKVNPRTKEVNDGKWDQKVVHQVLTNRTYSGWIEYPKGAPDAVIYPCPAIIEQTVWGQVQIELRRGKEARSGRPTRDYLFTRLIRCLLCGHRVTTFPRRFPKGAYRCGNIDRKPPMKRHCPAPGFEKDYLDPLLYEDIWRTFSDPARLHAMVELSYKQRSVDPNCAAKIEEVKAEIIRLERLEKRAHENVSDPDMPRNEAKAHWNEIKRALREGEFRLNQLQEAMKAQQMPSPEAIEQIVRDIIAHPPQTFEEKRKFIELVVREIRLSHNEAHIDLRIPDTLLNGSDGVVTLLDGSDGEEKELSIYDRRIYSNHRLCTPFSSPPYNRPISFQINAKLTKLR